MSWPEIVILLVMPVISLLIFGFGFRATKRRR